MSQIGMYVPNIKGLCNPKVVLEYYNFSTTFFG